MDHSYNAETINYYFGKKFVIYFKPLSANNSVFMLHFFQNRTNSTNGLYRCNAIGTDGHRQSA